MAHAAGPIEWRLGRMHAAQSVALHGVVAGGASLLVSRWPFIGCGAIAAIIASAATDLRRWHSARAIVRLLTPIAGGLRIDATDHVIRRAWLGPFATAFWLGARLGARQLLYVYPDEVDRVSYAALRRHAKSLDLR